MVALLIKDVVVRGVKPILKPLSGHRIIDIESANIGKYRCCVNNLTLAIGQLFLFLLTNILSIDINKINFGN
jgi:hypothetical protein